MRGVLSTQAPFQIFGGVAAIYFLICYGLTLLGRALERRLPSSPTGT